MRLEKETIEKALSYFNPLHQLELGLRVDTFFLKGSNISDIENLGVAQPHESIDFTENNIALLGNFPLSPILQTLLCGRNRISTIQSNLADRLPNLSALVLTENNLRELADLVPLGDFQKLERLSIMGNPVASKENYRYFVIWLCPSLRFFDFQKVKDAERKKARELFGTRTEPTTLAQQLTSARSSRTAFAGANTINGVEKSRKLQYTAAERARFTKLITETTDPFELQKLEKAYEEGRLPPGVADVEMGET